MLLIKCPYCQQERAEIEFSYAGEAHIDRPADPSSLTDAQWETFLFHRSNPRGSHFERWYHIHGCRRYFNAVRDTLSDRLIITYQAGAPRPGQQQIKDGGR